MVMDPLMNALAMTDPNSGWSAGGRPSDLLASLGPPKLCCHAVLFDPFCSVNLLSPGEPTAAMLLCCSSTFLVSPASSAGRTLTLSAAADSLTLRVCRAVLAAADRDQRQLHARRSVASRLADRAVPVRALRSALGEPHDVQDGPRHLDAQTRMGAQHAHLTDILLSRTLLSSTSRMFCQTRGSVLVRSLSFMFGVDSVVCAGGGCGPHRDGSIHRGADSPQHHGHSIRLGHEPVL